MVKQLNEEEAFLVPASGQNHLQQSKTLMFKVAPNNNDDNIKKKIT